MTMNGKRDGFTMADFRACAGSALLKRGRAEGIVEQVRSAVSRWSEFAGQAQVTGGFIDQILGNLRLDLKER